MRSPIIRGARPPYRVTNSVTFTGAATLGGAASNTTWFTVTGEVLIEYIAGWCVGTLGEAAPTATITLGVTGNTALFIAATNSTALTTGLFWVSATPTANGIAVPAALKGIAITDNILSACATQNTNSGTLRVDCWWRALSSDGNVV